MNNFQQLPLKLPYRIAFNRSDFFVTACNQEAVAWIDRFPNWPSHAVLILGPAGSGKTHLSHIFSRNRLDASDLTDDLILPPATDRLVIENIDRLGSEQALFHLFNLIRETKGFLLLTARSNPKVLLPDLQSRLNAIPQATILKPDDELIFAVLTKSFFDRHILIEPQVVEYAVKHMERSFQTIRLLIDQADQLSLAEGRKITIPIMKQVLEMIRCMNLSTSKDEKGCVFNSDIL